MVITFHSLAVPNMPCRPLFSKVDALTCGRRCHSWPCLLAHDLPQHGRNGPRWGAEFQQGSLDRLRFHLAKRPIDVRGDQAWAVLSVGLAQNGSDGLRDTHGLHA